MVEILTKFIDLKTFKCVSSIIKIGSVRVYAYNFDDTKISDTDFSSDNNAEIQFSLPENWFTDVFENNNKLNSDMFPGSVKYSKGIIYEGWIIPFIKTKSQEQQFLHSYKDDIISNFENTYMYVNLILKIILFINYLLKYKIDLPPLIINGMNNIQLIIDLSKYEIVKKRIKTFSGTFINPFIIFDKNILYCEDEEMRESIKRLFDLDYSIKQPNFYLDYYISDINTPMKNSSWLFMSNIKNIVITDEIRNINFQIIEINKEVFIITKWDSIKSAIEFLMYKQKNDDVIQPIPIHNLPINFTINIDQNYQILNMYDNYFSVYKLKIPEFEYKINKQNEENKRMDEIKNRVYEVDEIIVEEIKLENLNFSGISLDYWKKSKTWILIGWENDILYVTIQKDNEKWENFKPLKLDDKIRYGVIGENYITILTKKNTVKYFNGDINYINYDILNNKSYWNIIGKEIILLKGNSTSLYAMKKNGGLMLKYENGIMKELNRSVNNFWILSDNTLLIQHKFIKNLQVWNIQINEIIPETYLSTLNWKYISGDYIFTNSNNVINIKTKIKIKENVSGFLIINDMIIYWDKDKIIFPDDKIIQLSSDIKFIKPLNRKLLSIC